MVIKRLYKTTAKPLLTKTCPVCSILFQPRSSNLQIYCSKRCQSIGRGLLKNNQYSIAGYNRYRSWILDRDNPICSICKDSSSKLEIHHIKPVSNGGSNFPDNLQTVCNKCHKEFHTKVKSTQI